MATVVVDVKEPTTLETPAAASEVDKPSTSAAVADNPVSSILRRFKREDLLEKSIVLLRGLTCFFSLISIMVMGTNKHGDWKNFDLYQEYKYLLAIGVLAFMYSTAQVARQVHRVSSGRDPVPRKAAGLVDFIGDQLTAYLLISALSAAIPLTNRMREGSDNMFTDATAASISMAFFAFAAISLSAIVSGYKLSKQTYI